MTWNTLTLRTAPIAPGSTTSSINLSQSSDFQRALIDAKGSRDALFKAVQAFTESPKFVSAPDATPLQKKLVRFGEKLDTLSADGSLSLGDIRTASQEELGSSIEDISANKDFQALGENLRDTLVAVKFNQVGHFSASH